MNIGTNWKSEPITNGCYGVPEPITKDQALASKQTPAVGATVSKWMFPANIEAMPPGFFWSTLAPARWRKARVSSCLWGRSRWVPGKHTSRCQNGEWLKYNFQFIEIPWPFWRWKHHRRVRKHKEHQPSKENQFLSLMYRQTLSSMDYAPSRKGTNWTISRPAGQFLTAGPPNDYFQIFYDSLFVSLRCLSAVQMLSLLLSWLSFREKIFFIYCI